MKIYIEKIIFINRAPIEKLEIDFKEDEIAVLSSVNGKGKTTILSHIADAFFEMARPNFHNSFETRENKFYRISSHVDILNKFEPSFVYIRFRKGEKLLDYIDCRNNCTEEQYNNAIQIDDKIPFNQFSQALIESGFYKGVSVNIDKKQVEEMFNNNVITYFPAYRFEQPGYLNDPYKVKLNFNKESRYSGQLINPIEVVSGLPSLVNWIMDIILDGQYISSNVAIIKRNIDLIITYALSSKNDVMLRLGVGQRNLGNTRVQIVDTTKNVSVYPSIFNLSSGEAAIVCVFGEVLRQADKYKNDILLEKITGIVVIDEIDKHLHIKLQKEILPKLFNLFPSVQFIVSSHSPFLGMGLACDTENRSKIIDLDNLGVSKDPTINELYTEVYNMMINENNRFKDMYVELNKKIIEGGKTLVITEGKTDIKHIIKAKEKLNIEDLDFETIEMQNQPEGSSGLLALLEKISQVNQQRKIIGIFDRDEKSIINKIAKDNQKFMEFGNNVYAFCISTPSYRVENGKTEICIEFLYTDDEIKSQLKNGCRLFLGNEFTKKSMMHNCEELVLRMPKNKGDYEIIDNNGGQSVYTFEDKNVLAKKEDFANAVLDGEIEISNDSWENFRHIFDTIKLICQSS